MADKKIIAVVGATGNQGGGLVRAILKDAAGPFSVRAVTRDPDSEGAKALADSGAEVVPGDVGKPESMRKAFDGAYGAFCVTFWSPGIPPEKETEAAHNMAEAAKAAELKHVIWSTFEDTRTLVPLEDDWMPTLQGKYKVPHFDAKSEGDHFFTDLGVPTTMLYTSFYWENLILNGMGPKPIPGDVYQFTLPMGAKKLPGIDQQGTGVV